MKGFLVALLAPVRTLRSCPGLAFGVALTIGIGLGGTLAIVGLLSARLLAPLPYRDPSALVVVQNMGTYFLDGVREGETSPLVSILDFEDLRANARSMSDIGGACVLSGTMRSDSRVRPVKRVLVTPRLLSLLGVRPVRGRLLSGSDFATGAPPAVMVPESTWRRRFGADETLVGRTVLIDNRSFTVIGILGDTGLAMLRQPSGVLDAPTDEMVVSPLLPDLAGTNSRLLSEFLLPRRNAPALAVVGRLRAGRTIEEAEEEVRAIGSRLAAEHRENKGRGLRATSLPAWHIEKVRGTVGLLLATAVLVFVVASLSASGLVVADSARHHTDGAIMQALGAPFSHVIGTAVGRAIVVTIPGGVLAIGIAAVALQTFDHFLSGSSAAASALLIPRVGMAAVISTLCAGAIAGVAAAWASRPRALADTLKHGQTASASRQRHGLMKSLVTLQVAAATVVAIGSGLAIRSLWNILAVDMGFDVRRSIMIQVRLPREHFPVAEDLPQFVASAMRRVRLIPGVTAAGATLAPPLSGVSAAASGLSFVTSDGARVMSNETLLGQAVTPGYMEALGMKLVRGRRFVEADMIAPGGAAVVDQGFCNRFLGGGVIDPLTLRILFGRYPTPVVGVVGDVRPGGPLEPARPMLYMVNSGTLSSNVIYFVVRSDGLTSQDLGERVTRELARVDSRVEVGDPLAFETAFAGTIAARRQLLVLLLGAAVFVAVLTALSVVSCLAQYVAARRRDIAIRLTLGARPSDLGRLLASHIGGAVAWGLVEGSLAGLALGWTLSSEFYGLSGADPATVLAALVVLAVVSLAAAAIPASQAIRIDPARTLKAD